MSRQNLGELKKISSEEVFLPEAVVKLVLKICKTFEISKFDTFSVLETLQAALYSNLFAQYPRTVKETAMIILNAVRLTEKFQKSANSFAKNCDKVFEALGMTKDEYNDSEVRTYHLMDYKIINPEILEEIYYIIEKNEHLNSELKNSVYECAVDVLTIFYSWKYRIFNELQKSIDYQESLRIISYKKLVAVSIFCVAIKLLKIQQFSEIFDVAYDGLKDELSKTEINEFSGLFFRLIKQA